MKSFNALAQKVLNEGHLIANDRTGVGTLTLFGEQLKFDLMDGFPLVGGSKKAFRWIFEEQMAFLNAVTSNLHFEDRNITIWDEWALKADVKRGMNPEPYQMIQTLAENFNQLIEFASTADETSSYYGSLKILAENLQTGYAERSEGLPEGDTLPADSVLHLAYVTVATAKYPGPYGVKRDLDPNVLMEIFAAMGVNASHEIVVAKRGDLGPIYGEQWRNWKGHDGQRYDQIEALIDDLIERPYSRRLIVSAWNPAVLPEEGVSHENNVINGKQVLPPCHTFFQCHVRPATEKDIARYKDYLKRIDHPIVEEEIPDKVLDLQMYQRSADLVLGVPYNIAAYAFLQHLLARHVNMIPGVYTHTFGNVHVYQNHIEKLRDEQLTRELRPLPDLAIDARRVEIYDTIYDDVRLIGYDPHPRIDYPVAV